MMSNIMGKTLQQAVGYLQKKLPDAPIFPEVNDLVHILSTKKNTRLEEITILEKCLCLIQTKLSSEGVGLQEKRFCIMTLIFCCNYGMKTNKLHHYAIQFIDQAKTYADKKFGYIAISILLEDDCTCLFLLVNTILKDINSVNVGVIQSALGALCNLIVIDIIPVLLPSVQKRLSHENFNVRIQSASALKKMFQIGPEFVKPVIKDHIKALLCDKNPSVMAATLPLVHLLIKADVKIENINETLIFILNQAVEGKLPLDLQYKGISGAWIQLTILFILKDIYKEQSDNTVQSLKKVIQAILSRLQVLSEYIHAAIFTECIYLITIIDSKLNSLIELCLPIISTLLFSRKCNYIYAGLYALTLVGKIDVKYLTEYKNTVMKCLDSSDDSIRKMALKIVKTLTNKENVKSISEHLIKRMLDENSQQFRTYLLGVIMANVKKYEADDSWMLQQLHHIMSSTVFIEDDNDIVIKECKSHMNKVSSEIKLKEVKWCVESLKQIKSFTQLTYVLWVLVTHTNLLNEQELKSVITTCFEPTKILDSIEMREKVWLSTLNALQTILLQQRGCVSEMYNRHLKAIKEAEIPCSYAVLMSLMELQALVNHKDILNKIQPLDLKDKEVDCYLSFLDEFIEEESFKNPLPALDEDIVETSPTKATSLKFYSYHEPRVVSQQRTTDIPTNNEHKPVMEKSFLKSALSSEKLEVNKVWDLEGYLQYDNKREDSNEPLVKENSSSLSDDAFSSALFSQMNQTKNDKAPNSGTTNLNQALVNLSNVTISIANDKAPLDITLTKQSGL